MSANDPLDAEHVCFWGVKQTSRIGRPRYAYDPKRTLCLKPLRCHGDNEETHAKRAPAEATASIS
jgi:hypothetical protein